MHNRDDGAAGRGFVFDDHGWPACRDALLQGVEALGRTLSRVEQPFSGVLPQELAPRFAGVDLDAPVGDVGEALAELDSLYLQDAVYFHHPRYVAHLNCPIVWPAVLAELLLSAVNSSLDTWDQSAGGTLIERSLIAWTAQRAGLGDDADGVFTSGGTQSNLMGLLLARDRCCAAFPGHAGNRRAGLPDGFGRLRILASEASHFSVQKSAALLGLGYDAVVSVPCDERYRLRVDALQRQVAELRAQGLIPMAVVATAGTTDFGSIDPLPEIAELCRREDIWLHVDAAYGGALLLSSRRRDWLAGIAHADSLTVDYHKSFFQPVSCSAFLVRERGHLGLLTHHADYLNPKVDAGPPNQVDKSLQTTRRFDALKLWLTLRVMGADTLGQMFDAVIDRTHEAYQAFRHEPRLEFAAAPTLSTLVFRYLPEGEASADEADAANVHIRRAIFRSGRAVVAATRVGGRQFLKFTLLNPETRLDDLRFVVGEVLRHGRQYQAERPLAEV